MRTFVGVDALRSAVGQQIGTSDWLVVTQERVNAFAEATGDHQWIHVDEDRAVRETPFGGTIAHGFLTLSLVSSMLRGVVSVSGLRMTINYGLNRVRFVSPVPVGSRIRAQITLSSLADATDGVQATWLVTMERQGADKPCLVAEWLVRYYPEP